MSVTRRGSTIVPQATLSRVRALIDALAGGADSPQALARAAGFSARHMGYALDAAIVLGLVERSGTGLAATERGRGVAATANDSEAERQALLDAMRGSSTLATIAPDLLHVNEPTRDDLAAQLARAGGLAPATAAHRTAMLLGGAARPSALRRGSPGRSRMASPTQDQLAVTRTIDVAVLRGLAPSFDKLVQSLARALGAPPVGVERGSWR